MASDILTTTVSTKGQVILPKSVRDKQRWEPDTKLQVELTAEGVVLKKMPDFVPTKPEDVFGMLRYEGPPVSVEEMNAAIPSEVKRRYARNRY